MSSTLILVPFIMSLSPLRIQLRFMFVSHLLSRDWSLDSWLESLGVLIYVLVVSL